jgi:phthiodiolone/phenolphthiodiolone dimycocerosates ketoreductase
MDSIDVGLVIPPNRRPDELRQLMRLGRLSGVRTFLLWDHWQDFVPSWLWDNDYSWSTKGRASPHEYLDVFTALGYLAGRGTGRVQIGTGVTDVLRRHPISVAQAALTLAQVTKRAPVIGIGAGERENTEPYGIPFNQPVGHLEEALHIIRECLDGSQPIDFHGQHYQLDGAVMDLTSPNGCTPELWLASHGPRMLRLAGRYADGWFPTFEADPVLYEQGRRAIEASAEESGRDLSDFTWSFQCTVGLAPTDDEAEASVRESPAAQYVAVAVANAESWHRAGADHPFGPDWRGFIEVVPGEISRSELRSAMDQVPAEVMQQLFVYGSPKTVAERIKQLGGAGLNHVTVLPISPLFSKRLYRYFAANLWRVVRELRH